MIELKSIPLLTRGFRRAFGIGTEAGGVDRLNEAISPAFDIFRQIEHRVLRGELSGGALITVGAGGAGNRSIVQLWNPATSSRLVILERAGSAAAASVSIDSVAVSGLITTQNGLRDTRTKRIWTTDYDPQLRGEVRADSGAALSGTAYYRWRLAANVPCDLEFVLRPGTGVAFDPGADNTAITAWFAWRERDLVPGEQHTELW